MTLVRVAGLLSLLSTGYALQLQPIRSTHMTVRCRAIRAAAEPQRGEVGYKRAKIDRAFKKVFGSTQDDEVEADPTAKATPESAEDDDGDEWVSSFAAPEGDADCDGEECVLDYEDEDTYVLGDMDEDEGFAEDEAAAAEAPAADARWSAEETERLSRMELASVRADPSDPTNPADTLRAAGEGGRVLDEMELACCWLQHEGASEALPLPRFRVTARPSKILEPELRQMASVLRAALDRNEPFTIMWDLRKLRPPSLSALSYGAQWMGDNAADIERLGRSITVLVSGPLTRACANLCCKVCNPPQPVKVCADEAAAAAFARAQHERA